MLRRQIGKFVDPFFKRNIEECCILCVDDCLAAFENLIQSRFGHKHAEFRTLLLIGKHLTHIARHIRQEREIILYILNIFQFKQRKGKRHIGMQPAVFRQRFIVIRVVRIRCVILQDLMQHIIGELRLRFELLAVDRVKLL
ncbi:hypothetical protein SDC9_124523 [bioreactor metagenome]|uniref:Uncharacterized protein n=1 Tax=bioreactor metagenome TaxID=1076179 RepID=A0A645CKQ8_9ZZZZ